MHGRLTLTHPPQEVAIRFAAERNDLDWQPNYGLAPGRDLVVVTRQHGQNFLETRRWGLLPNWIRDPELARRLTHARAETLAEKPAFRRALAQRRCIVPVSGCFEWAKSENAGGEERVPLYVSPREGVWALAGLWEEWRGADGSIVRTVAVVTTPANRLLAPLTQRMSAILCEGDWQNWLDPQTGIERALRLLRPWPEKRMQVWPVARQRSDMTLSDAARIAPVEDADVRLQELRHQRPACERAARLYPLQRHLRREGVGPDGQVFFRTRSWTQNDGSRWHPVIDTHAGPVFCDCPDFRFRHAWREPDLTTPQFWCKHIGRAVRNCQRHGEI